jgi:uncharacterized membrane protein YhdT
VQFELERIHEESSWAMGVSISNLSLSLSLLFFAFSGEIHQLSCIFLAFRFNCLALPMFMQHLGLVQATRFLLYRSL